MQGIKHFVPSGIKTGLKRRFAFLRRPPYINEFEGDVTKEERDRTDLHKIFYDHSGPLIHKWTHYLDIYEQYLAKFRGTEVRLLEIGVSQGGSLSLWRKFLGPQAVIFGIDIDERCSRFDGSDGRVRIGSQADSAFLRSVVDEVGGLDVVIDDGSHIAEHQKASFEFLFPLLSPHGIYLCEDLHASYWPRFSGGYKRKNTFIEIGKALVDDIHADFHTHGSRFENAEREIKGVHFYNSIIVIEKQLQPRPSHVKVGSASF